MILKIGEHEVIIDPQMKPIIDQYSWHVTKGNNGGQHYARTSGYQAGKPVSILMHRLLTGFSNLQVDHMNGNGLDNRLMNLRLAKAHQNCANYIRPNRYSKFKGVRWCEPERNWSARLRHNNVQYNLGRFKNEIDAARAYAKKSRELNGEFAKIPFEEELL